MCQELHSQCLFLVCFVSCAYGTFVFTIYKINFYIFLTDVSHHILYGRYSTYIRNYLSHTRNFNEHFCMLDGTNTTVPMMPLKIHDVLRLSQFVHLRSTYVVCLLNSHWTAVRPKNLITDNLTNVSNSYFFQQSATMSHLPTTWHWYEPDSTSTM